MSVSYRDVKHLKKKVKLRILVGQNEMLLENFFCFQFFWSSVNSINFIGGFINSLLQPRPPSAANQGHCHYPREC